MRSTRTTDSYLYIGADLTDRYSTKCRPIDVCGLVPAGNRLTAYFWHWEWDPYPQPLKTDAVVNEIRKARSVMLDGPQGLALPGESLRSCERQAGAVGKTPDTPPPKDRPFATYIHSSLELFLALHKAGILVDPPDYKGGVSEVYPGHIWSILSERILPKKSTMEGRLARKLILEVIGVAGLPELPTHDQNDACVGSLMGAAADGKIQGMIVQGIGLTLKVDNSLLREGRMVIPMINEPLRSAITTAIAAVPAIQVVRSASIKDSSELVEKRATELLSSFVERANGGDAQICTYSWAYRHIFNASYNNWSQAYAKKVIQVAERTPLMHLPGLGALRLDAFIVAQRTGRPSIGHWRSADHDPEDWERVLGTATVLHRLDIT
jgi:hypothetical protein